MNTLSEINLPRSFIAFFLALMVAGLGGSCLAGPMSGADEVPADSVESDPTPAPPTKAWTPVRDAPNYEGRSTPLSDVDFEERVVGDAAFGQFSPTVSGGAANFRARELSTPPSESHEFPILSAYWLLPVAAIAALIIVVAYINIHRSPRRLKIRWM